MKTPARLATFSISARCAQSGQMGVAITTKFLAVGSLAPNAKAGLGACSSQAFVNPYHKFWMLDHLAKGASAEEALQASLAKDPRPELRQLAIVDATGRSAAHTGEACDGWCGHKIGNNFAAAGNMLANGKVVDELARVFEETEGQPLAERLLQCLEAAQAAGGDKRGKQSSALYIVDTEDYAKIDLRVDDHPEPVKELQRLYSIYGDFEEVLSGLPSKANPAGEIGDEFLRKRGLMGN